MPDSIKAEHARPSNIRWLVFVLACGTSWTLYLHRYTYNFIRPELEKEYGFNNAQLDGIFAAFNITYAIGQVPSGIVCDFFGPHLFLGIIVALWSILLPCVGLTGNIYGLTGIRLGFGAAQAGCYPGLAKVTQTWFPLRIRTTLQGIVASSFGRGGAAMSSIIMGYLLMGTFGLTWRTSLLVLAGLGLFFAAFFLLLFRSRPDEDQRVNQAEVDLIRGDEIETKGGPKVLPVRRALRNPSLMVFTLQQFMNAGADMIYVYLMGSYFMTERNFDVKTAALLVSLPLWGGALGGFVGGFINDGLIYCTGSRRWSRTMVGFTGKFLAALLMFVAISQVSGVAAAWGLFAVKFFSDWTQPTVWGACTDMGGRFSATVFSIMNTAGNVGASVTPLVLGIILDAYSTTQIVEGVEKTVTNYTPIFVIVAGMYMVSAICWFFINCTNSLEREAI